MSAQDEPALREALYFAALTYRGWARQFEDPGHASRLGNDIRTLHSSLSSTGFGSWELLWGPATHRMMRVPPDDTCVCVWRQVDPPRLMVALRGTNPGSPLDWILGDFWAATQLPWEWDDSDAAKISASTALGLATVLNLRSLCPAWVASDTLWPASSSTDSILSRAASVLLRPARDVMLVAEALGTLIRPKQQRLQAAVTAMKQGGFSIQSLRSTWEDHVHRDAAQLCRDAIARSKREGATALVELLDGLDTRGTDGSQSLIQFLHRATAGGAVEVVVTGHSKAGAVAVALATWLAQTRGPHAPDAVRWDPARNATVVCRAFAGPTPGNASFGSVVAEALPDRCTRVFNPLDLVPHAWRPDDIRKISKLYASDIEAPPGLSALGELVASSMEDLQYAHAGTAHPLKTKLGPFRHFPLQAVHQHLDAYLQALGLTELSAELLFK